MKGLVAHDAQHKGSSTLSNANVSDGVHLPTPGVEGSMVRAYDSASGDLALSGCFVFRAIGLEGNLASVSQVTWALEYASGAQPCHGALFWVYLAQVFLGKLFQRPFLFFLP